MREKLTKQAEGMDALVKSAGTAPDAVRLLIADKLETIVAEQVKAISGVKIDKVTVWDGGEGKDGKTSTANFLSGLLKSLPPLEEIYNMAGLSLPKVISPRPEGPVPPMPPEGDVPPDCPPPHDGSRPPMPPEGGRPPMPPHRRRPPEGAPNPPVKDDGKDKK